MDEPDDDRPFEPDWASPPGNSIRDIMEELGLTEAALAGSLEVPATVIQKILQGDAPVTEELAQKLSVSLGASPGFWLRREAIYRSDLARLKGKNNA